MEEYVFVVSFHFEGPALSDSNVYGVYKSSQDAVDAAIDRMKRCELDNFNEETYRRSLSMEGKSYQWDYLRFPSGERGMVKIYKLKIIG